MARRLSVRKRGPNTYEVGPTSHGPTVVVAASSGRVALERGKAELRERDARSGSNSREGFRAAVAASWRDTANGVCTRA